MGFSDHEVLSLHNVLARFSVIFSLIAYSAMTAEASNNHRAELGLLQEVRNGLIGADTFGQGESTTQLELLDRFPLGVRRSGRQDF